MRLPLDYFSRNCRSFIATLALIASSITAQATTVDELANLSLEELASIEVTSVSKSSEALRHAAATIYVITRDEILRSGATSIPEVLRLAPNIEMRQQNANSYVGAARGFAGHSGSQNFSNKLLIVIDGRSVYSPLFSGIYYDAQDVLLEDIERVEVISGAGSTLWGANAMNGVVNIITRAASSTNGGVVSAGAGNFERSLTGRFGDSEGNLDYRVYAKTAKRDGFEIADGTSANDAWRHTQVGFRMDWSSGNNTLTAQGDGYRAMEDQGSAEDLKVTGFNALARWSHLGDNSELQVQTYFDRTQRAEPPGGAGFVVNTFDVEIQQTFSIGSKHKLTVGGGERINRFDIDNSATLLFVPAKDTLHVGNLFAHDTVTLSKHLQLSLGLKLEQDPYSGWELLPDLRLSWRVRDDAVLWASAARAIRSPTPFDHGVQEYVGPTLFLNGNEDFEPERVNAFELGYRGQPWERVSLNVATFYNRYDELRSIETASPTVFLPLRWGNQMRGTTYGVEAWAKWQIASWWRLSPGVRALHKKFEFKPGASQILGTEQQGNDPTLQALLGSAINVGPDVTIDVWLRYSGDLPDLALDEYYEANARVGWQATDALDFSLNGFNLLHERHRESPETGHAEIERSVLANARWRF